MTETKTEGNWIERSNICSGDHVMAVVTHDEDLTLIPPYVTHALAQGDPSAVVLSDVQEKILRKRIQETGVNLEQVISNGDLMFVKPAESINEKGRFDIEIFLNKMHDFGKNLLETGTHVRASSAMSLMEEITDVNTALKLEARLNEIYDTYPFSGL